MTDAGDGSTDPDGRERTWASLFDRAAERATDVTVDDVRSAVQRRRKAADRSSGGGR